MITPFLWRSAASSGNTLPVAVQHSTLQSSTSQKLQRNKFNEQRTAGCRCTLDRPWTLRYALPAFLSAQVGAVGRQAMRTRHKLGLAEQACYEQDEANA